MKRRTSDLILLALQEAGANSYASAVDEDTVFRLARIHTDVFHSRHFDGGKFLLERKLLWQRVAAKEVACVRVKREGGCREETKHKYLFYLRASMPVVAPTAAERPAPPHLPVESKYAQSEKFWVGTKLFPFILLRTGALSPESALERAGLVFRARYSFSFYDPVLREGDIISACLDYCVSAHRIFYTQTGGVSRYFLSEDGARFLETVAADCQAFEHKLVLFEEFCVVLHSFPQKAEKRRQSEEEAALPFLDETCTAEDFFADSIPTKTATTKVCLVVDSRESKGIIRALERSFSLSGLGMHVTALQSGDYTWAELDPEGNETRRIPCVIERKTLEDFGVTVSQNRGERHKRQVEKLLAHGGRVCYLIEGKQAAARAFTGLGVTRWSNK